MSHQPIHLTSSEIASLWTAYMNDSMSVCVLRFMLKDLQDEEIREQVQYAYDISAGHLEELTALFRQEKYAIPNGFTEQDVNMDAPWLFSDVFCLTYVNQMARVGMLAYSGFLAMSARSDIRMYFTNALSQTATLYNQTTETAIAKGLYAQPPYIELPKESDYVNNKKYLKGLNPFSTKRPLNAIEISYLYMNIMTNHVGVKLSISFAQTSPTKEVREYMLRGNKISGKHIKIFADTLLENNIQAAQLPDVAVSDSSTKTFSDKLLMFHMSLLASSGIGNYATAAAASQRSDLAVNYERLSFEIAQYAKDGADLMIKHAWLEQPPGVIDREQLAKRKDQT
ncbi:hypothetical protein GCM10011409_41650 [Lentibacillus populi]|uniref:DUF3231 family protein n=1 Tax=Lentibacillus populi TaxID=1827502 RepID=A0A9W5U1C6_9BACI|nr:DUF3231 family protein [Lentibacillus populi]GGB59921.1 hypothetical protein GCM10011409_41650 [Lentibacillus populi]